jgi:glycosyltransferase involved in cell wall biosynthesis
MPLVSIIVPCYNEQATINLLLDAVYKQTCPRPEIEVIIADGLSTDHTREEIASYQRSHNDLLIKVINNSKRNIPAGLNQAIAAATGQYIIRLDGHAVPDPDYVERCVELLESKSGDNIGGVWDIKPSGPGKMAQAIAIAAAHPMGVGDAQYRYTHKAQEVDTVPFGAFNRTLVERIGGFDEKLLTNEDYEFNVRIRQSGGKVWLDPTIRSIYYARANLGELSHQYWRYGYWKAKMLRHYPFTIRWRQALPPTFIVSLLGLGIIAILFPIYRYLLIIEIVVYLIVLFSVGLQSVLKKHDITLYLLLPLALIVMHFSWGLAFLWSFLDVRVKNST